MKIVGLIAEYNPFHNGHLYQLQEIRKLHPEAFIIAVMSGSITQRGTVACLNKWQRACCAVKNGVDLVIELPCCFALRSAQYFAAGGIQLLHRLNIVKYLAFGAETNDLATLNDMALLSMTRHVQDNLKNNLKNGQNYAAALSQALCKDTRNVESIIHQPNNILAIEYLKELHQLSSDISPLLITRSGAQHNSQEITGNICSASAIRKLLPQLDTNLPSISSVVPAETFQALQKNRIFEDNLLPILLAQLRFANINDLHELYNINEGLENVMLRQAAKSNIVSLHDFCLSLKSKRYSYARLRRNLIYILLHLESSLVAKFTDAGPLYLRILAFNQNGKKILQLIKQNCSLPIVTRPKKFLNLNNSDYELAKEMLKLDIKATELQSLCLTPIPSAGLDYITPPVLING